jgi:3-isopropylmalate/(R)-2-methylmalate dehydratase small subunit
MTFNTDTHFHNGYKQSSDSFRKKCLLEGLDDIGLTLQQEHLITEFEINNRLTKPWLY